jgi:hypothetical protein
MGSVLAWKPLEVCRQRTRTAASYRDLTDISIELSIALDLAVTDIAAEPPCCCADSSGTIMRK